MARTEQEMQELMVEQVPELGCPEVGARNPMVLSCGGIFIPRPRPMGPKDELFKILNVANSKEPTKVVFGSFTMNLLQEVLHKESMN